MKTTVGSKIAKELKKAGLKVTTIVITPTKEDRIRHKEVMAFIKMMDDANKKAVRNTKTVYKGV